MSQNVKITTPYITLGQLLKLVNLIGNGGEAKAFLALNEVRVNGEVDQRRGRKLYPGDKVLLLGRTYEIAS
jgi:S4 domain protein YaaA